MSLSRGRNVTPSGHEEAHVRERHTQEPPALRRRGEGSKLLQRVNATRRGRLGRGLTIAREERQKDGQGRAEAPLRRTPKSALAPPQPTALRIGLALARVEKQIRGIAKPPSEHSGRRIMTPLEIVQKGYDCFEKGDVTGVVELYSDDSTFTPQMGLEGKVPLVTPKISTCALPD
jgi:hypothetical protein